jgi:hypothetical protein
MSQLFRLYWLRETGCDAGTPLGAHQLEPEVQIKALELAAEEPGEFVLSLPYLDQREWRKRGELFAGLAWERCGNAIAPVLPPAMALRNTTATLALTHPAWIDQPSAADPRHVAAWQHVSVALQRGFREWIAEEYFRDAGRFADREKAYTMIVYQAARVFYGRSRGMFTYDLRDYPECRLTLALATKMIGRTIQNILGRIEQRLLAAGMPDLARRYAPAWYQDVLLAVRRKPKAFIALLSAESAFIDALVELGLNRTPAGVHHFSKIANQVLRKVYGSDARHLGVRALQEATRVLAGRAGDVTAGDVMVEGK